MTFSYFRVSDGAPSNRVKIRYRKFDMYCIISNFDTVDMQVLTMNMCFQKHDLLAVNHNQAQDIL
jgi:hypothetical protein